MTAFNFPASPTVGQTYTAGGITYTCTAVGPPAQWTGQTSPLPMATAAQWLADVAGLVLVTDPVWSAASPANLTDAATVALDMSTFINADLLLTAAVGATRVLGNPSNVKRGQTGVIKFQQPASGGPCALTYASNWKWLSGVPPVLTTTANATDFLSYYAESSTIIVGNLMKAVS